jgi:hypothetical protein
MNLKEKREESGQPNTKREVDSQHEEPSGDPEDHKRPSLAMSLFKQTFPTRQHLNQDTQPPLQQ